MAKGGTMKEVRLFQPYLPINARKAAYDAMKDRWIGCGKKTEEFEKLFSETYGVKYSVATNSCTSALHLAYTLAGVKEGDEVITSVFTCTATNIPIKYCGATPVYADIQPDTFNIDPEDIKRKITDKTKAIALVHWGGYPADMYQIMTIAKEHNLKVIVDAAHALGATYNGTSIAQWGDYVCYSFQAIKQITTVEGGMLVVNTNEEDYKRANILRWYGIDRQADRDKPDRYEAFTELGWRYIPNDVFMAMGIVQFRDNMPKVTKKRKKLAELYYKLLKDNPNITFLRNENDRESGWWLMTVICRDRDKVREVLAKNGIMTGMAHYRNDISPAISSKKEALLGMDSVDGHYLCLPIHYDVTEIDVKNICSILNTQI